MKHKSIIFLALGLLLAFGVVLGAGTTGTFSAPLPKEITETENTPAISLGQPGTVFRYVETFGETGVPYLANPDYLYTPRGLGLDSTGNLWIADGYGALAAKYTAGGEFLISIGTPGFTALADETHFCEPTDVTIDGDGNLWVVDRCSARVVKFDPTGTYLMQLGITWEAGTDNDHFDRPHSVEFDSNGNIYVSDQTNQRVQVFDNSGVYLTRLGVTGEPGSDNDHFNTPHGLAIDADDNLYVADTLNHRVQVFDADHNYVATLGVPEEPGADNDHFNWPFGIAVDADQLFVADHENHRVQIFERATLNYQSTLGSGGTGENEFILPTDVAVDSGGNVYVADHWNNRVQKFDSGLVYLHTFGTTGVPYVTDGLHYNQPNKVAVDADGNIGILEDEGRGHRFILLDASGVPQFTIGEAGVAGIDNEHFSDARGVAFDSDGNIYIGDCANHRVQIYNSDGVYQATLGSYGQANDQFNCPTGLAFDDSGNLYVADSGNQRIQIFNSSLAYSTTLGETGISGADNDHFNQPQDVAVDADGNIYVADTNNLRVQKFDSSHVWQMTMGVAGECGGDFDHFCTPFGVAVDAAGNVYVADHWTLRVQVFDATGAYLTTIGGEWGDLSSQFRTLYGVAVDSDGNVYIPDMLNHRVQKFALGVPNWEQVNINGFGERDATGITALDAFNGQLYAGVSNWETGAQIYRAGDGNTWSAVTEPGFGYTNTVPAIIDLGVFDGQLYASTGWGSAPGQVWRSQDGATWEPVTTDGFGDGGNTAVFVFIAFNGMFYASTANDNASQIWRSASGDPGGWTQVAPDDPGAQVPGGITGFASFKGSLYAAVEAGAGSGGTAQVWRSTNGSNWETIVADGFGDANNLGTGGFAEFGGYLYLGTQNNSTGAQLWRSLDGTTWEPVVGDGFGEVANQKVEMLVVFANRLYAEVNNAETGLKILRLDDGIWESVNLDGFGDSNNVAILWNNSTAKFQNHLYLGTWNDANGGEIWRYDLQEHRVHLPLIQR